MSHLYLSDGDVVILTYSQALGEVATNRIKYDMKNLYDHLNVKNIKTLILEEGMDIKILKNEPKK